jgi:hypothetical protein
MYFEKLMLPVKSFLNSLIEDTKSTVLGEVIAVQKAWCSSLLLHLQLLLEDLRTAVMDSCSSTLFPLYLRLQLSRCELHMALKSIVLLLNCKFRLLENWGTEQKPILLENWLLIHTHM